MTTLACDKCGLQGVALIPHTDRSGYLCAECVGTPKCVYCGSLATGYDACGFPGPETLTPVCNLHAGAADNQDFD